MSFETGETGPENRFDGIATDSLIGSFYDSEGTDKEVGDELTRRLFAHFQCDDVDITVAPMFGSGGERVVMDDRELVLVDYINFAAKNHPFVLPEILAPFDADRGTDEYKAFRQAFVARMQVGVS